MQSEEEQKHQNLMTTACMAIQTLYSQSESIPSTEKQAASNWLGELQRSVEAWKVADQLLHQKLDLHSCFFAALTLRLKIQNSFKELPIEAHCSLRDSLLQHVSAISIETDAIIVTQLCITVADLILQMTSWADPVGHLLAAFGSNSKNWWPVLEILRLLPEEVHSRKLKLGDNRRNQLIGSLENVSPTVFGFLRQCLAALVNGPTDTSVCSVELCCIEIVKCFGSWVSLNPECFCSTDPNDSQILAFALMQLREGKCGWKMHAAATDCLCAVVEVLPSLDSSSNNNAVELQNFQVIHPLAIKLYEPESHVSNSSPRTGYVSSFTSISPSATYRKHEEKAKLPDSMKHPRLEPLVIDLTEDYNEIHMGLDTPPITPLGSGLHEDSNDSDSVVEIHVVEVDAVQGATNGFTSKPADAVLVNLFTSIMSLEDAYHYSVVQEENEKTLNYCRIFTEYAESMVPYMLRSSRDPHYSIRVIDLVLISAGHHDYEVAEVTYGFWYQLSEDLYHAHDDQLNAVFRPYIHRLILCLYKHCRIEPDHEGPLTSNEEFYDFRKKSAELFQDVIFVIGSLQTFNELAQCFMTSQGWDDQEAALYLLTCTLRNIEPNNKTVVAPVVERLLSCHDWRHVCLQISAIRFFGGLAAWLAENPEPALEKSMQFLVKELTQSQTSTAAATSLQSICEACCEHIAARHMNDMLCIVNQVDQYSISNEAAVGLFKGVGHVVSVLPSDQLSPIICSISRAQLEPLSKLVQNQPPDDRTYQKGSKEDPTHWLDRLAALYRSISVPRKNYQGEHPCKATIVRDFWPVISKVCEKHQADARLMERCCRCIRFSIRCIGKDSVDFLQPLTFQLVSIYNVYPHSCFLYLASILVDEFGSETQCIEFFLNTLQAFMTPTFNIFNQPDGLRNHPDTVDDFFRLCTRYIQRCSLPFLRSAMITPLIQVATQASLLDHREANIGVMKFLYDLVHVGRRHKEAPDAKERCETVKTILRTHGPNLVSTVLRGAIFDLPSYVYPEICDFLVEIKEFLVDEYPLWLEAALKNLPDKTASGNPATTLDQLQDFHKKATNARSSKELNKALKEFNRLFR